MEEFGFPEFECYPDESDPDTVTLRQDGTIVKALSVRDASREEASSKLRRKIFS